MQQVIDRTLYDTEQAEAIAQYAPLIDSGDYNYLVETLYKTAAGDYFLHGDGGAATKWAEKQGGYRTANEEIELLTEDEAVDWCETRKIDGEIIVEEFGHLISNPATE